MFGFDLAERWKQIAALVAVVTLLVGFGVRFTRAEEKLKDHDSQLAKQTEILEQLTKAALAEQAAKKARIDVCRALRESGKIQKGECPKLED